MGEGEVRVIVSCSWCHEPNRASRKRCVKCGHNPTKARMNCDCPRCKRANAMRSL